MTLATHSCDLQTLYAAYRENRSGNRPARYALAITRQTKRPSLYPVELKDGTRFEHDGFSIRVRARVEEWTDISWLGHFSDQRGTDAIRHEPWNRRTYAWFNPKITVADHRQGLSALGYSRQNAESLARQYVQDDYRAALRLDREGLYQVTVTASRQGIELGSADANGCEWDEIEQSIIDYRLIEEAISNAREALQQLCECV